MGEAINAAEASLACRLGVDRERTPTDAPPETPLRYGLFVLWFVLLSVTVRLRVDVVAEAEEPIVAMEVATVRSLSLSLSLSSSSSSWSSWDREED
jgi:hypothetical protein